MANCSLIYDVFKLDPRIIYLKEYGVSEFDCGLTHLPLFLESIKFNIYCIISTLFIIFLTFWIKYKTPKEFQDYHFYILNQVFFDLLQSIYRIFREPCSEVDINGDCYSDADFLRVFPLYNLDKLYILNYITIFIGGFARFLALFFPFKYNQKFNSTKNIIKFILLVDLQVCTSFCYHANFWSINFID